MKKFGRIIIAAFFCGLLFRMVSFAEAVPEKPASEDAAEKNLSIAEKAALEGKTLLPSPPYAYIANGKLYWGGQAENIGVRVDFLVCDSADDAGMIGSRQGEVFSDEADVVIVKTGKDPVDVAKIIRDVPYPYYRVRCIPEYNTHKLVAASEWLEPADNTVDRLKGLGLNGWIYLPGKWFYFKNGEPHRGRLVLGGKEYYMDRETGAMQFGWIEDQGKWYYFQEGTGELFKDGITSDGYEVDKAGAWTGRMTSPKKYPWQ